MGAAGLIIGILCGSTAAAILLATGSGVLLALAGYTVFGSMGLLGAMLSGGFQSGGFQSGGPSER